MINQLSLPNSLEIKTLWEGYLNNNSRVFANVFFEKHMEIS